MRRILIAVLATLAAFATVFGIPAAPASAANAGLSTLLLGLNGVSCVSAKFCAAVGSQGDSAHLSRGDVPLTMIWNGARWRKIAVPLPRGLPQGELDSVSCRSAAYCVAVGDDYKNGNYSPLAETWNGRVWTATALPKPAGPVQSIGAAISCAAARSCVAIVSLMPGPPGAPGAPLMVRAFAETLTGTKWTLRDVPLPKGSVGGSVGGISCISAAYCVLADNYIPPSVLFESWNGKAFTPMKAPSPAGSIPAITGVSCVSAKSCTAIGTIDGPLGQSFAMLWNGKTWSVASVPGRKGLMSELDGVSCASATRCVAVGVASTNGSEETSHALAVSYDGRSWASVSVPALAHGGTSAFNGVSCVSATACVAVGEGGGPGGVLFSNAALTGFWNGKSWKLVTAS